LLLFVLLLGVPALPPPTGGATHVFEIIAVLLALELMVVALVVGVTGVVLEVVLGSAAIHGLGNLL
jgi:hypothetical protein